MIKVYSKPDCMQCKFAKNKMNDLEIPYEEFDITTSEESYAEAKATGFTAMPIIILENGDVISGFQPDKLEALAE